MKIKEIIAPADYTTKLGERVSYWTYFIGQNIFYNVVTTFMATDLGRRERPDVWYNFR